ncbi:glutathione S-transferase T3-like protein [Tanacetum coccineum]|uniref:Glutathione S-transferase T3-like protein n=1 Tax=Tanacetum coccineum TaxID=301880 RepID=A0ABQ5FZU7_9ASTR
MPSTPNHETSQHVSRNLFEDSQIPSRSTEKISKWETKEDIALMAAWCQVSGDPTRGNNQRKSSMWAKIWQMYEQTRAENPKDIGPRNENQMKGRFKRLNENASKWVAAYKAAYSRMKSGMSMKDVELDAHKIYEGDGSKFLDLTVFNEVMCKHPKWMLNIDRDNTRSRPIDEEPNEESGGSTKRSRTSEEGEYVVHSNQETPNSGGSTIQRPIGRDAAKKKGKGKASQSFSSAEFVEELRAMRITRESEIEVMNKRLEVDKKREEREIKREERELKREERELKKEERKTKKMYLLHLNALLAKDHLSPEDEDMKRNLYEMLYGK